MPSRTHHYPDTLRQCVTLLAMLLLWPPAGAGAEIIGRIKVAHTGLFAPAEGAGVAGGISVSITPLAGQPLPAVAPRTHRVVIRNKTFAPVFMTVQRGDFLQFVSKDPVFHKLFSLSKAQPFTLDMGKATVPGQGLSSDEYELTETGPWHVFCRIHSMMYFRADVVDTPYYTMIDDGGEFHFTGLAAGRWRVRVAALGSEPLELDTDAITAPPPLEIVLPVKGSGVQPASAGR